MSISGYIQEVTSLNNEINRRSKALRELRSRKKKLEKLIIEFLDKNKQRGITYKGRVAVIKEEKPRCIRRRKPDEKTRDISAILRKYGVSQSADILNEINQAIKGPMKDETILTFKNIKN